MSATPDIAVWLLLIAGVGVVVLGVIAGLAIIAIAMKRPGLALTVGLVLLLGVGSVFGLFFVWRAEEHRSVQFGEMPPAIEISPHDVSFPTMQYAEMPQNFPGTPQHSEWKFSGRPSFVGLLMLGVVTAGIVFAVASLGKHKAPGQHRRSWWPALLLVPVVALIAAVFLGYSTLRVTREFGGVPQFETFHQDFSAHLNVGNHQLAIEQARVEAQRRLAETQADVKRAQQEIAEQARAHLLHNAEAKRDAERAGEEAVSALLRTQFATMDINQLIEAFQGPRIQLSSTTTDGETPTPAASEPPVAPAEAAPAVAVLAVATAGESEANTVEAKTESSTTSVESAPADENNAESQEAESQPTDDHGATDVAKETEAGTHDSDAAATAGAAVETGDDHAHSSESPKLTTTPAPETKPLPKWVGDEPGMHGPDWREVVITDEYATADECRQAMDIYLMFKTAERVQSLTGHAYVDRRRPSLTFHQDMILADGQPIVKRGEPVFSGDDRLHMLRKMGIGIEEIRRSVVREEHLASRDSRRAFDTMYRRYTLAQFTPWFEGQLRRHWDSYLRQERFEMVGAGAGSVIGLLGLVFGLLKIDTWTKGYYSKRLFIGVPGAIIGVLVLWSLI